MASKSAGRWRLDSYSRPPVDLDLDVDNHHNLTIIMLVYKLTKHQTGDFGGDEVFHLKLDISDCNSPFHTRILRVILPRKHNK